jgi:NADH-quinone oxidoreductase subunit G
MVRDNGMLKESTWDHAYKVVADKIKKADAAKIGAIAGDLTDVETMLAMKEFLKKTGSGNYDCRQDGSLLNNSERALYIFNTTIAGIEQADFTLLVGCNPRHEAAILNARIRKTQLQNKMKVALIGEKVDLNYDYKYLGANPWLLKQIAEGQNPYCEVLKQYKKPMLIIGSGVAARDDWDATLYYSKKLALRFGFVKDGWNGFNILQRAASRVGGLDIGFIPEPKCLDTNAMLDSDMEVLFLMGADEVDTSKISPSTFVVYIGHHGDRAAYKADVILPAAAFTEKSGTYVNLEGRVQQTERAVFPLNEAKEDWKIICELAQVAEKHLGYNTLADIRKKMAKVSTVFTKTDVVRTEIFPAELGKMKDFTSDFYHNPVRNFYMTDPISRNSRTMAQCSKTIADQRKRAA